MNVLPAFRANFRHALAYGGYRETTG
jgi:hypothetical protein